MNHTRLRDEPDTPQPLPDLPVETAPLEAAAGDDGMMSDPPPPISAEGEAAQLRWKQQLPAASSHWSRLSDDQLEQTHGAEQALSTLVEQAYGLSQDDACEQVRAFLARPAACASAGGMTDLSTLRGSARAHIEKGAVTAGYSADRCQVLQLLNNALATELVCVLRYRRHHFMARGIHGKTVASEFLIHSNQEQAHADLIAQRIVQLGGEPDFSPDSLSARSHAEYIAGANLTEIIKENLVAERIAIDSYRELIEFLGSQDPTTSQMLKQILAVEEEHADELADLLVDRMTG